MRILYIVPYAPNPIRIRPYNLIRGLAARGHAVTVAAPWSSPGEQADLQSLRDRGIDVIAARLSRHRTLWNCLRCLPTHVPLQALYCWQPALARAIQNALQRRHFDVVHVEHLRGAAYGLHVKALVCDLRSPIPIVWDSVDCISYLFEQAAQHSRSRFSRWITRLELKRTRRFEGWLSDEFDRILITSPVDQEALGQLHSLRTPRRTARITVLPNGVDLAYFAPTDEPRQPDTVAFTGKMSYHANVTGALHLMHEIMPLVWAQRPGVRVWVVGKDPPREVRRLSVTDGRIEVTGTVPDMRPYLQRATVAAAPAPYSAGIQNKVLEAMACGTPVVASPRAVSSLDVTNGRHALVARDPAGFADAVLSLLEDPALCRQIGRDARRYVEMYHDWRLIAEQLEAIYGEFSAIHVHPRSHTP